MVNLTKQENLPLMICDGNYISQNNIFYYLQELTEGIPLKSDNTINMLIYLGLVEVQFLLNHYNFLKRNKKTSVLMKIIKILYQPLEYFRTSYNDRKALFECQKLLGVTTILEVIYFFTKILDKLQEINDKFENYLIKGKRINCIDFLIYACYKAQKRILRNKVKIH